MVHDRLLSSTALCPHQSKSCRCRGAGPDGRHRRRSASHQRSYLAALACRVWLSRLHGLRDLALRAPIGFGVLLALAAVAVIDIAVILRRTDEDSLAEASASDSGEIAFPGEIASPTYLTG